MLWNFVLYTRDKCYQVSKVLRMYITHSLCACVCVRACMQLAEDGLLIDGSCLSFQSH